MPWQPGQSGNPAGKPKRLAIVRDLAREHTEKCIEKLAECLEDKDRSIRIQAAKVLLERGWGRPEQAIHLSGADGGALFPVETAREMLAKLLEKKRDG
jgi:HEAT repeat protein